MLGISRFIRSTLGVAVCAVDCICGGFGLFRCVDKCLRAYSPLPPHPEEMDWHCRVHFFAEKGQPRLGFGVRLILPWAGISCPSV